MLHILDKIIQNKTKEVHKRKSETPISELANRIQDVPMLRPFSDSLQRDDNVAVIAEIKRSSPSAGLLRADFDPITIARCYERNGASAISVLTDQKFFGGNIQHLHLVREYVDLPILRKDFILDPYQVIEARAYGADAILLILSLLSESQCAELVTAAREYGLETLVEVHTTEELKRALELPFSLIGVNNRNLNSFSVDLSTTEKLITAVPSEAVIVSESGIRNRQDIERLSKLGIDAVLVGETLMREQDVGGTLSDLVGVPKWSR